MGKIVILLLIIAAAAAAVWCIVLVISMPTHDRRARKLQERALQEEESMGRRLRPKWFVRTDEPKEEKPSYRDLEIEIEWLNESILQLDEDYQKIVKSLEIKNRALTRCLEEREQRNAESQSADNSGDND